LEEVLAGIGNTIGVYVKSSEATKQRRYTSYARICVYLNIAKPLPGSITLEYHDEEWSQTIDYEHIPFRCRKCHEHGHLFRECPLNAVHKEGAEMIIAETPDVVLLQETKCTSEDMDRMLPYCWKQGGVVSVDAIGTVGGLAILWNTNIVLIEQLLRHQVVHHSRVQTHWFKSAWTFNLCLWPSDSGG
jgi:hypothetical protein